MYGFHIHNRTNKTACFICTAALLKHAPEAAIANTGRLHTTCKSDLSFTNILHTIFTSNLTIQRRHNPISYASYLSGDMNVMGVCWISALSRLKTGASLGEGFSILFVQVFISSGGETQVLWLVVASIDPLERLNMSSRSMRK